MDARRLTVTLVDGVRVAVPDSLELMTPYVLQEQHDWFEDEIKFVRVLLEPGDRALDVGANYGVYTLSMARAVGPEGHVWAFEPASHPASFLAASIAENAYANVTLEKSALSDAPGSAELALGDHSELNTLSRGTASERTTETVRVTTLDERLASERWTRIDFAKIDAEGEEAKIVIGARRFLAELAPLVQYEVRSDSDFRLDLVEAFAAEGFRSYRLIPALNVLAPFDSASAPDPFLLNLFACKPEREAKLAARNLLVRPSTQTGTAGPWQRALDALRGWRKAPASELDQALALHGVSRDGANGAEVRFRALQSSVEMLARASASRPTPLRLASYARAALDFGAWKLALDTLTALGQQLFPLRTIAADEPFLAPAPRFDTLERRGSLRDWLLAATLDAIDRACSYSSFFDREAAKARLTLIDELGYADDDVRRRLSLIERRSAAEARRDAPTA